MILILCPRLNLHHICMLCSQILFVIFIKLWCKSGTFRFSPLLACMKSVTSFSRYSSQVARPPLISGYVSIWVSRSIWAFLRFFGFLVKILRSSIFDLKLHLGPILPETTFFSSLSLLITYLWLKLDFKPISQEPFLIWSDIFDFLGFNIIYWVAVSFGAKVLSEWLGWSFLELLGTLLVWEKPPGPIN